MSPREKNLITKLRTLEERLLNVEFILASRHLQVTETMERQRNDEALRETREILRDFPTSPRTHYLHACIQARLAKDAEGVVTRLLFDARKSLADAVENGIVKLFVLIGNEAERRAPLDRIRKDPT